MAMTPAYALAHTFLPNHTRLKGPTTIVSALERKDTTLLDAVWNQAFLPHKPRLLTVTRDDYRIAVIDLPPPKDMGEAHLVAWVVKKTDPSYARYFLLEHDYVLATKSNRTVLSERHNKDHKKLGDGSPITGDFATDANAFVECFAGQLDRLTGSTLPR